MRPLRRIAAICAVAVAAVALAGPQAVAAPRTAQPNGWRITQVFPQGSELWSLTVGGKNSAWVAETCMSPCHEGRGGVALRHWNGTAWQLVSPPAILSDLPAGDFPVLAEPAGSSTVWAFYSYIGPDNARMQGFAVHWTGSGWTAPHLFPKGTYIDAVTAPSPSDVWVFGQYTTTGKPFVARWDGKKWSTPPSPGFEAAGVAARSPNDIWAASFGTPKLVSHWNGSRWTRVTLPAAINRVTAVPGSVTLSGPHDIWVFGYLNLGKTPGIEVLHFNGTVWSLVTVPFSNGEFESKLGSDGKGGIWFWGAPGSSPGELIHYSGGHWTNTPMPLPKGATSAFAGTIAPIPGTTKLLAAGYATLGKTANAPTEGVVMRYGW